MNQSRAISRAEAEAWAEAAWQSMSREEKLGHLICPDDRKYTPEDWAKLVREVPVGSVFFGPGDAVRLRECLLAVQEASRVPVLVAADLEFGAGAALEGGLVFPRAMALGAVNEEDIAYQVGRATAAEARSRGVHWALSPVVDLARNPANPVVNVRALGDDPARVAALACAWIRGMQEDGRLAACAKHFPGDGDDDRDQHLCTPANPCRREAWWATHGRVWREVVHAGVASVMAGHIALPAWEDGVDPSQALPATLSPRVQEGLLRGELGFQGVLVSDAAPMLGLTSRVAMDQACVASILAGTDVFLFGQPREDFQRLACALEEGRLAEPALRAKVMRVLRMKAALGLHRDAFGPAPTEEERTGWERVAEQAAQKSLGWARNNGALPLRLKPGARLYLANLKVGGGSAKLDYPLSAAVETLRSRGYEVTVEINPSHRDMVARASEHDALLVNFLVMPHSQMGTIRLVGEGIFCLWRGPWLQVPDKPVVFTSFGSPFHLEELPHLPNLLLAYGDAPCSQRAAALAWLGEIPVEGRAPVARLFRNFTWADA